MKAAEGLLQLRDRDTDKPIFAHAGSVYWNDYRRRWVMIAVQKEGASSFLGEVWYAEADAPVGPWVYAVKVVTHDRYSFYNPKQDPMFDKDGGRLIFFEGTYTHTFSGNPDATPRYDYNQILYKLDLSGPRLCAADAGVRRVGRRRAGVVRRRCGRRKARKPRVAFFAPDRPFAGGVAVLAGKDGLRVGGPEEKGALFYALPADAKDPPAGARPLYECRRSDGDRRAYSVGADADADGLWRVGTAAVPGVASAGVGRTCPPYEGPGTYQPEAQARAKVLDLIPRLRFGLVCPSVRPPYGTPITYTS